MASSLLVHRVSSLSQKRLWDTLYGKTKIDIVYLERFEQVIQYKLIWQLKKNGLLSIVNSKHLIEKTINYLLVKTFVCMCFHESLIMDIPSFTTGWHMYYSTNTIAKFYKLSAF